MAAKQRTDIRIVVVIEIKTFLALSNLFTFMFSQIMSVGSGAISISYFLKIISVNEGGPAFSAAFSSISLKVLCVFMTTITLPLN